jgi:hypothetical protein
MQHPLWVWRDIDILSTCAGLPIHQMISHGGVNFLDHVPLLRGAVAGVVNLKVA